MKKKIILIIIIVVAIVLLVPIPMRLKDGGSIRFQALLYNITKYHKLDVSDKDGYVDGMRIEILGIEVFNNIKSPETITETTERRKVKDVKILNSKNINTKELVKFNGIVYGRSNFMIDYAGNLDNWIGTINFLIDESYFPEINGETNNRNLLNSKVLEANEKSMILNIDNVAVLFDAVVEDEKNEVSNNDNKNYNSFVGTVLEETTTYMIVEPNEDEDERKSADKIRINYGTDHYDYLYGIGRKVIIKYTGYIKETYPAQIDTNEILIDGYEDFELSVKKSDEKTKSKILNNQDLYKNNSNFDLYYYGLDEVNISVDNETMSLENALKSGKMTIDGILIKANQDASNGKIKSEMYKDGGTTEWYYDTYTIIKCHSLDGNRDVYIGIPEMRLNTIK